MSWSIEVPNLKKLENRLDGTKLNSAVKQTMVKATQGVKTYAQKIVAYKTGTLRRSIFAEVLSSGVKGIVSQDPSQAIYGKYIEYGTRAHTITPVYKRALFWKGAAHPVMVVNHPGSRAQPFMSKAFEDKKDEVVKMFSDTVSKLLGGK